MKADKTQIVSVVFAIATVQIALVAAPALAQVASHPSGRTFPIDEDGCWDAPASCIRTEAEWRRNDFISRYTNICSHRVYLTFCNEATEMYGGTSCGADGVRPNARKGWDTSKGNGATGRYA